MKQLHKNWDKELTDSLLHYIWKNWCALGVSGSVDSATDKIIDPEALLLFTCSVGRCDQRLFDEVMDWLTANWELMNVSRLKHMLKKYSYSWIGENALPPMAAWMIENQRKLTKWQSLSESKEDVVKERPFFINRDGSQSPVFGELDPVFQKYGFSRGKIILRGYSRPFNKDNPACLLLSLRSFLGTNVRAEIIAFLLTHPEGAHPSSIAREIGYNQKSVQNALVSMKQSKWVNCHETSHEKIYTFDPRVAESFLGSWKKTPKWMNLSSTYSLIESVWEKVHNPDFKNLSEGIQAIELREAIMPFAKEKIDSDFAYLFSGKMQGKEFVCNIISEIIHFIQ